VVVKKIGDMTGGAGFARELAHGVPMLAREYPNISAGFHPGRELALTLFELLTTRPRFREEEYHISKGDDSSAARANLKRLVRLFSLTCADARGHGLTHCGGCCRSTPRARAAPCTGLRLPPCTGSSTRTSR
jgi:hypothetical protein